MLPSETRRRAVLKSITYHRFGTNYYLPSSGEKVVPSYREDAAAGCILGHMIYCWITTPLPLFTGFVSQLVPALPKIKLHLEGDQVLRV